MKQKVEREEFAKLVQLEKVIKQKQEQAEEKKGEQDLKNAVRKLLD